MGLSHLQACEINFEALVFLDKLIHGEPAFPARRLAAQDTRQYAINRPLKGLT